ncbi:uncharacterized protein Z520_00313 [Fonsecaea multimorphosa CBS 102226]|uniref:DUF3752 domain-containing protein n=1 Tax=Fonsecaea multimorphosa CBS 102226 TaxID=1442371 RepID=A0A0D2J2F9_9EURO|nr:uncharacterized protein Z520_00313 [Fonsecaea multimorphosa CBS 102226]KIY03622.1 hypothetical protein Z520_00313 [Fonsecaea multimorphosa CBS 102226]OAL32323.1 hypothetical protein AYO22_00345 [Fonsecaea multimorphosa]
MSAIGPQLPPHLQNRKRSHDEDDEGESSDSSTGPLPAKSAQEGTNSSAKRPRVVGPSLPPAPLDERPPSSPPRPTEESDSETDEDDDDDDTFGPSLPSANDRPIKSSASSSIGPQGSIATVPVKRDEWMTVAPSSGDWSARVDPTKLKNRKFNTGRGAKGPSHITAGTGDSSWHETPEQKQARLKREVMGINDASTSARSSNSGPAKGPDDEATARRLKEYNETQRGPSLYSTHTASQNKPLDDDPSARAFDREKDIGSGSAITATQRRDMVKKASDFSSRFEKARYL